MFAKIENPQNKENIRTDCNAQTKPMQGHHTTRNRNNNMIKHKTFGVPTKKSQPNKIKPKKTEACIIPILTSRKPKKINFFSVDNYYLEHENSLLFNSFGDQHYKYFKTFEPSISSDLLKNHTIKSDIHMKMIDWMIEVLSVYHSSHQCFFLAVKIMDSYLQKTTSLRNEDLHLIGMTSMFIASKFEDVMPISCKFFVSNIGHNQFTLKKIFNEEKKILNDIGIESLITVTLFDHIKMIFFDFENGNKTLINEQNISSLCGELKKIAIYLCIMIYHFEYFYNYNDSSKAIACIMTALSVLKSKSTKLNQSQEKLFFEWIQIMIRETEQTMEDLVDLYIKISDCYDHFPELKIIAHHLKKFHPLNIE